MRRISKSVRYSSQQQATLLIRTFLCVWNRLTLLGERSRRMKQQMQEMLGQMGQMAVN
jgi:hypothetical protein